MLPGTGWCGAGLPPFPTACWWLTHPAAITGASVSARWDSPGGCGGPSVLLLCNCRVQSPWCQFASGALGKDHTCCAPSLNCLRWPPKTALGKDHTCCAPSLNCLTWPPKTALGKDHTCCAPSLNCLPKVAPKTAPIFLWFKKTDCSQPHRVELPPLPFSP